MPTIPPDVRKRAIAINRYGYNDYLAFITVAQTTGRGHFDNTRFKMSRAMPSARELTHWHRPTHFFDQADRRSTNRVLHLERIFSEYYLGIDFALFLGTAVKQ
ncbi:hypothetical protein [Blastopirellula marina]|uniref:Uncharacterized protein n=1 Tax=Blastopirellula marina TaxID=124 RepID=A0A2S8FLB2_9BACT|nr:hypothetical protein [Blastopirellula marina]PQO32969.1 hypothetical protein C5Y98_17685 [Blastopirellula marina]PTL43136.1 hypothetical protein C5Y97_17695 [Blastopirellula marina]